MQLNHSKTIINKKINENFLWIEKIQKLNEKIINNLENGSTEEQELFCTQRESLIRFFNHSYNEIKELQSKDHISNKNFHDWNIQIHEKINQVLYLNDKIIKKLEENRKDTVSELSSLYQKRKIIQTYNLSNTK